MKKIVFVTKSKMYFHERRSLRVGSHVMYSQCECPTKLLKGSIPINTIPTAQIIAIARMISADARLDSSIMDR